MNKRTVQVEAHSLHDADVRFISLVKRGANKVPVRILKSETLPEDRKMSINLSGLTKVFSNKSQPKQDVIAGITIQKGDSTDKLVESIGELGFKTEVEDHNEFVLLKQDEMTEDEELVPVNYGNGVIALVRTEKSFLPGSLSEDFQTNLATESFFPSVGMALDTFFSTVREIMFSSDTADEAATKISQAANDFRDFTVNMVQSLPSDSFVLEKAAAAKDEETAGAPDTTETEEVDKSDTSGEGDGDLAASDNAEVQKGEGEDEPEAGDGNGGLPDGIENLLSGVQASIQKSLDDMSSNLKGDIDKVSERISAMETSNSEISDRLEKAEKTASAAEKAVKGAVTSESQEADGPNPAKGRVKKSEDDVWQGVLDFPGISGGSQ